MLSLGYLGVDFFFVLSGFIAYAHREDARGPAVTNWAAALLILIGGALAAGVLYHLLIEPPLLRFARRKLAYLYPSANQSWSTTAAAR